ncbi:MAG: rubrerythrin-like domain-containing protein [Halolamina sp.]
MNNTNVDPYTPDVGRYECLDRGERHERESHPGTCPDCSGRLRNVAVPRE